MKKPFKRVLAQSKYYVNVPDYKQIAQSNFSKNIKQVRFGIACIASVHLFGRYTFREGNAHVSN